MSVLLLTPLSGRVCNALTASHNLDCSACRVHVVSVQFKVTWLTTVYVVYARCRVETYIRLKSCVSGRHVTRRQQVPVGACTAQVLIVDPIRQLSQLPLAGQQRSADKSRLSWCSQVLVSAYGVHTRHRPRLHYRRHCRYCQSFIFIYLLGGQTLVPGTQALHRSATGGVLLLALCAGCFGGRRMSL
jgi:hypothetical protein